MKKEKYNSLQKHYWYLKGVFEEAIKIRHKSLIAHNVLDSDGDPIEHGINICEYFDHHFEKETKFLNPYLLTYGAETDKQITLSATKKYEGKTYFTRKPENFMSEDAKKYVDEWFKIKPKHFDDGYNEEFRRPDQDFLIYETIGFSFKEYVLNKHDWNIKKFFTTAANLKKQLFTGYKSKIYGKEPYISAEKYNPAKARELVKEGLENIKKLELDLGL